MNVDFDIEAVKEKAKNFTLKKDKISAAIQLGICVVGVAFVLIHELKGFDKAKKKVKY